MKHAITLTPGAVAHIQSNLDDSPDGTLGVRFGLRDAGCSGYAYTFDFTKEKLATDEVFEFDGVSVYVDRDHLKSLDGTEIDYAQSGINSTLSFNNPNVVDQCGCGESFKFKEDIDKP